jgi:hypothetical protein
MATEITAKGDLIVGTGSGTFDNLPAGTNGFTLVADSVEATGLKWVAPAASTLNYTLLNAGGTSLSSTTTTVSITAHNFLFIHISGGSQNTASGIFTLRFNSDSATNYWNTGIEEYGSTLDFINGFADGSVAFGRMGNNAANTVTGFVNVSGAAGTGYKPYQVTSFASGGTDNTSRYHSGAYIGSSAITSVSVLTAFGYTMDAGTIFIYGAN